MTIGQRLRMIRKQRGYKLRHLSLGTALSVSFLSDVEHGRVQPSIKTVQMLADFYGVKLSDIFLDVIG